MAGLFSGFSKKQKYTEMITKMVEDALERFSSLVTRAPSSYLRDEIKKFDSQVKDFQLQLRFLKMFLWSFPQWDDHNGMMKICISVSVLFLLLQDLISMVCPSLKSDAFTRNETVKFLDFIQGNMNDLVEFAPGKSQIKALKERLVFLRDLIHFTPMSEGELDVEFFVYDWVNKAASLTILHCLHEEEQDEETGEKLRGLHLDLLQKTPDFIRLCFGLIKVPTVRRSDTLIFGEFLSRFVDFFLENIVYTLKDDVPMLREGLILLITFLADPPANDYSGLSFFQNKIHAVLDQASHTIHFFGETSMDLARGKTNVVHLQKSIDEVRGLIFFQWFYVQNAHLWSNFPRTNGLGHFESLLVYLENLKEAMNKNKKLVPFLKHRIFSINVELMLLRPFLQDIWKMQNEHEEVKDLCEQIMSLSYQSDLAIKSSFFIDHPIWYNLTCLSFVVEKIQDMQSKVMRIKDIYRTEVVPPLMSSVMLKAPTSPSMVEVVVGFKHVTEVLIDRLTRGTKKLDIVSIVGMGGIGKTTLAKKLFNEPSIRYHFHKRAFCCVSQEYRKRNVLLDILSDLCAIDDEVRQKSNDDLAHMLKKCLIGCKYLIVMDDIWDIDDWYDVRSSFPDNNNGSRVIFTTRINNISLRAKPGSSPYLLPFLSVDESWELLKQNIFHKDPCPLHLCKVGKLIAEKCRGLPLAIVVIAGLLTRIEIRLSHWNEVADTLTTFASSEGCKDVIRLSYKRLSDPLKSCFLYLGTFREDEKINAKMLTNLWAAEGFVLKSGSSCCLHTVAKQYLNELGDRNLVTVTRRSCKGEIKHFYVHDLIRDFCRTEAREQQYWCFVNSHNRMPSVCNQYRVCNEDEWSSFADSKPRGPTVHSLLHYSRDNCTVESLESLLCNFKLVQVLDFRMVIIVGGFPTAVTTLVHLRYLALRIKILDTVKVPSEIGNLWNLETLLLIGYFKVQFPYDIWKMKRLRHVEARGGAHVELDDVSGVLFQLPDLENFNSLVIPPGEVGNELLRRLPNVRKLRCMFSGDNQMPKLDFLTNLESLQMSVIGSRFFRCPNTFSFPLTIEKLTLESFELRWNEFTAVIRKLPALQVLVLRRTTTSSDDAKIWDVQDEKFPNIISLTLDDLDMEDWKTSIDSFPCIETLKLSFCNNLIQVPPCFGEVPALKSVMVRYCNKGVADSALQIQNDQLDSGNEINLEVMHITIS